MKAKLFYPSVKVRRPSHLRPARFLLPALLLCIALVLASSAAQAHGSGYYQIRGAEIDSYFVHAWIAPGVPRTGQIHIDTVVLDEEGIPALNTFVQVSFVALDTDIKPLVSLAGAPETEYPYARGSEFRIDTPGLYSLEISVSDANGAGGIATSEVEVTTIAWQFKAIIAAIALFTAATGLWLLLLTRAFWVGRTLNRQTKFKHLRLRSLGANNFVIGGVYRMGTLEEQSHRERAAALLQRLNGTYHAPALWIFMLVIVAHWMEHVLQIYQIYALGWSPDIAGGILGVIYPQLVESEVLHFVYDFIQWAGIVLLQPGFRGRARTFWTIAMVLQTWHYIEHVLLMGQYLTGNYFYGAAQQMSILQYWFPRAELHFVYNLMVFTPMVIAVHYYVKPKLEMLAAMNAAALKEATELTSQS